jgi:hypothetical protein
MTTGAGAAGPKDAIAKGVISRRQDWLAAS